MTGLSEFIFHHNFFSAKFIESLSVILRNDKYCRKIDLSHNHFKSQDFNEEFFSNLHSNETMINLDFRNNEGFGFDVKKRIALILLKNVEILKKKKVPVLQSWLDRDTLLLTNKELPILAKGLNIIIEEKL